MPACTVKSWPASGARIWQGRSRVFWRGAEKKRGRDERRSNIQDPEKIQDPVPIRGCWNLELGSSLDLGSWMLDVRSIRVVLLWILDVGCSANRANRLWLDVCSP